MTTEFHLGLLFGTMGGLCIGMGLAFFLANHAIRAMERRYYQTLGVLTQERAERALGKIPTYEGGQARRDPDPWGMA